jgi:prepilin-type N-terminal cleavage/methylation domain-containing protein
MKTEKAEKGFSLIELTLSVLVMTIVMGIAFGLLNSFQRTYRFEESYADAQRNARFAMARLHEIIRSSGTNPTATNSVNATNFAVLLPPVTTAGAEVSASSLRLRSDLDGDKQNTTTVSSNSDVIVTSEDVTLRLDSVNRRIVMDDNTSNPVTTVPIADNIISVKFTDPNGATFTNKAILVELIAVPNGVPSEDPRYRQVSYTATIRLRNR